MTTNVDRIYPFMNILKLKEMTHLLRDWCVEMYHIQHDVVGYFIKNKEIHRVVDGQQKHEIRMNIVDKEMMEDIVQNTITLPEKLEYKLILNYEEGHMQDGILYLVKDINHQKLILHLWHLSDYCEVDRGHVSMDEYQFKKDVDEDVKMWIEHELSDANCLIK